MKTINFDDFFSVAIKMLIIAGIALLVILFTIYIISDIGYVKEIKKQNTELLKANQHLKSENTYLQKERDWDKFGYGSGHLRK